MTCSPKAILRNPARASRRGKLLQAADQAARPSALRQLLLLLQRLKGCGACKVWCLLPTGGQPDAHRVLQDLTHRRQAVGLQRHLVRGRQSDDVSSSSSKRRVKEAHRHNYAGGVMRVSCVAAKQPP